MISLWRIFWLEVVALVRSWTALMLVVASLGWMFAANFVLVTDATEEGKREMLVRYGLGGVFTFLVIVVLAAATGLIASEREPFPQPGAHRLLLRYDCLLIKRHPKDYNDDYFHRQHAPHIFRRFAYLVLFCVYQEVLSWNPQEVLLHCVYK